MKTSDTNAADERAILLAPSSSTNSTVAVRNETITSAANEREGQVPPTRDEHDSDGRDRRGEPERERRTEAPPVEPDLLRDHLPDRSSLVRQRRRQRLLRPTLAGHQAAAGSAAPAFSKTSSLSLASTRIVSPSAQ